VGGSAAIQNFEMASTRTDSEAKGEGTSVKRSDFYLSSGLVDWVRDFCLYS